MNTEQKLQNTTAETTVANSAPREGRRVPSWLISTLIHVGLLLCLALFQLTVLLEPEEPCSFTALSPDESVDSKTVESYGLPTLAEDSDVSDFENAFGEDCQFVEDDTEETATVAEETATVTEDVSTKDGSLLAEENTQGDTSQATELAGKAETAKEAELAEKTETAEATVLVENQEQRIHESPSHRAADPNWFRPLLTSKERAAQTADVSSTQIFHFAAKASLMWNRVPVLNWMQAAALYSPFQTGTLLEITSWAAVVRPDLSARCAIVTGFSHDVAQFLRHYGGEPWG